jgi:hypothetical protein
MQNRKLVPPLSLLPGPAHLKKGSYIRITKMRASLGGAPACPRPIYSPGAWNNILSLPVAYWMEGFLLDDVMKRDFIRLDRRVRDGKVVRGIFTSTKVCAVTEDEVTTFNSVYRLELATPFIPGLSS